jgi:hypothetical protein
VVFGLLAFCCLCFGMIGLIIGFGEPVLTALGIY